MSIEFVQNKLQLLAALILLIGGPIGLYEIYKYWRRQRFEKRLAAKKAWASVGIDNGDPITEADRPFRLPWE